MSTLTKADLIQSLQENISLPPQKAKLIIEAFFSLIEQALCKGEEVKISGLGVFKVLEKEARMGRNPRTGETKIISKRRVVSFRAGDKLKNLLNSK